MNIKIVLLISTLLGVQALTFEKKPITLFVYIAGDNSLGDYVQQDLNEMLKGVNDAVHVCACVNRRTGSQKTTEYVYMTSEGMKIDGPILHNIDSGDVNSAIKAAEWAAETFPCDKFVIDFWDHGSGALNPLPSKQPMRGVCWDDTTGHYLDDYDVRVVIQAINARRGAKVDIVAFDACLMAGLEVVYSLADIANYAVVSEETIEGMGFEYTYVLNAFKKKDISAKAMAKAMIESYDHFYHSRSKDYTLSAIDLSKIEAVAATFDTVAHYLYALLKQDNQLDVYHALEKIANSHALIRFDERDYADLASLYAELEKHSSWLKLSPADSAQFHQIIKAASYALRKAVIARVNSSNFNGTGGLSIYLPEHGIHKSYKRLFWTTQHPQWHELLKRYFSI